jgi:hypothetical protein
MSHMTPIGKGSSTPSSHSLASTSTLLPRLPTSGGDEPMGRPLVHRFASREYSHAFKRGFNF